MSKQIEAIIKTRRIASDVVCETIESAEGRSEAQWRDLLCEKLASHSELFPTGWYDPPPGGASVLIGNDRLRFDSLRKPEYWARADVRYHGDVPVMVYVSPVDRATRMLGDFAVTVYQGADTELHDHLRRGLHTILGIAERAEIGMSLGDVHTVGRPLLRRYGFEHAHIATITVRADVSNFGHTAPWADGEPAPGELPMDELREQIRTARRFLIADEPYVISETCAFTVEARLTDPSRPHLPNAFFHAIVTFSEGRKEINSNFDEIFKTAGMDYML